MRKDISPTILVVDDDPAIRSLLRMALEVSGYRALEAVNGEEAVSIAEHSHPDLILMDIAMPKRSGISAMHQIRKNLGIRVPIVAMTAYVEAGLDREAARAGFNEVLVKPLFIDHLKDTLNRHLN